VHDPLHVGLDLEMDRLHLAGTESPQLMRGPCCGHPDVPWRATSQRGSETRHAGDYRIVDLSDPAVPDSRQPYHAGMGVAQTDTARLQRLTAEVHRYARQSIAEWVAACRGTGYQPGRHRHGSG
jgi:hypothetical protein